MESKQRIPDGWPSRAGARPVRLLFGCISGPKAATVVVRELWRPLSKAHTHTLTSVFAPPRSPSARRFVRRRVYFHFPLFAFFFSCCPRAQTSDTLRRVEENCLKQGLPLAELNGSLWPRVDQFCAHWPPPRRPICAPRPSERRNCPPSSSIPSYSHQTAIAQWPAGRANNC